MSGKLKQATFVLLPLIGAAAGYAGLLIGLRRFIDGVGKVRMLCEMQSFDKNAVFLQSLESSPKRLYQQSKEPDESKNCGNIRLIGYELYVLMYMSVGEGREVATLSAPILIRLRRDTIVGTNM